MSYVASAVAAVVAIGTTAYSTKQQRKATDAANDRVRESEAEDRRLQQEAQVQSTLAAGASLATRKRRKSSSALGAGATGEPDAPASTGISTSAGTVTALGGGAPAVGAL